MRYRVTSPLTLGPGSLLGLTEAQAAPRAHALVAQGNGQYLTTAHLQFKAGEVIDCDGELPKGQAELAEELVDLLADPAAPSQVRRKAKARAKATLPDQADLVGNHQP